MLDSVWQTSGRKKKGMREDTHSGHAFQGSCRGGWGIGEVGEELEKVAETFACRSEEGGA